MAGYSERSLAAKLGIKPGLIVYVDVQTLLTPGPLDLGDAPLVRRLPRQADLTLLFVTELRRLERRMPTLIEHTVTNGMVWVCWPKKASRQPTDLDENIIREVGLDAGMVDVKVAAVDETWSALKFVRRLRDR